MVDLDELERLEREATPGPWEWNGIAIEAGRTDVLAPGESNSFGYGTIHIAEEDQNLIAALRNAAPSLFAELRTLRARVAELERDARIGAVVRAEVADTNTYGHAPALVLAARAAGAGARGDYAIGYLLRAIADALRAEEGGEHG